MDSSADGEDRDVARATSLMQRWVEVGRVLQRLQPELFRRTLAANEVTVVALSTARDEK